MSPRRPIPVGLALVALLGGCAPLDPMPADLPCREAGYAIAARTAECTGDNALGQARYDAYRADFECIEWSPDDPELIDTAGPAAEDLFSCAFTLRNLPCEMVAELGDDVEAWLRKDPGCTWVAKKKGGAQ